MDDHLKELLTQATIYSQAIDGLGGTDEEMRLLIGEERARQIELSLGALEKTHPEFEDEIKLASLERAKTLYLAAIEALYVCLHKRQEGR
jgi:hypothetical protein